MLDQHTTNRLDTLAAGYRAGMKRTIRMDREFKAAQQLVVSIMCAGGDTSFYADIKLSRDSAYAYLLDRTNAFRDGLYAAGFDFSQTQWIMATNGAAAASNV